MRIIFLQVFQAARFLYSWPLGSHLLTVLYNSEKVGEFQFTLTVDGEQFYNLLPSEDMRRDVLMTQYFPFSGY